jgi:hypothetical protein
MRCCFFGMVTPNPHARQNSPSGFEKFANLTGGPGTVGLPFGWRDPLAKRTIRVTMHTNCKSAAVALRFRGKITSFPGTSFRSTCSFGEQCSSADLDGTNPPAIARVYALPHDVAAAVVTVVAVVVVVRIVVVIGIRPGTDEEHPPVVESMMESMMETACCEARAGSDRGDAHSAAMPGHTAAVPAASTSVPGHAAGVPTSSATTVPAASATAVETTASAKAASVTTAAASVAATTATTAG